MAIIENTRSSIQSYLDTLESSIPTGDRTPPPPNIDSLQDAGIPIVSADEFNSSLDELEERRQKLLGVVESDMRQWPGSGDR